MSAPAFVVDAAVADVERPTIAAFARQLGDCLRHASGDRWSVSTVLHDRVDALAPGDGARIVVASMKTELHGPGDPATILARWRAKLEPLSTASAAVLLVTIVRSVRGAPFARAGDAEPLIERIRRLDRCAIDLSHATGAAVADLDRVFAHFGTRPLQCDYRLQGAAAAEVGAWTLLATLV